MVNTKYGLVTWDDADRGTGTGNRNRNQKDTFMKMNDGSNVVRILTKPHQYVVHKGYKPNETDRGFGWRIMCSAFNGEACPLCETKVKTQTRWYVGVIDRKTQSYKVLDIGFGIFKSIKTYNQDEDWGNPESYDIDIKVDKNADPANYYSCIPKPKKPLTPGDLALKTKVEEEYMADLLIRCKPPSREDVEKRMESIKKYVAGENNKTSASSDQKNSSDQSSSNDDDLSFADPSN